MVGHSYLDLPSHHILVLMLRFIE